jgi:hypothetical protein
MRPGSFTEAEYRASARLVRWLAARYDIPLDRDHLLGHDDVPAPDAAHAGTMHWDPGPYWNWRHYLTLVGAPLPASAGRPARAPRVGSAITIAPPYSAGYRPTITGCGSDGRELCAAHPVNFVYLRTAPSGNAPLLSDPVVRADRHPTGTTLGSDWTDKAVVGQTFVVAAVRGAWVALWYDGQRAWFHDPGYAYAVAAPRGTRIVETPARAPLPLTGTAYPAGDAFAAAGVPAHPNSPSGQALPAGQRYTAAAPVPADYYYTDTLACASEPDCVRVTGAGTGTDDYVPIRYNHRLGYAPAAAARSAGGR